MRTKQGIIAPRDHQRAERLKFIDEELFWTGEVTRRSIAEAFGVSEETAKSDLRDYRRGYATDLIPDQRDNVYRVPIDFAPRISNPDPESYLARLARRSTPALPTAMVPEVVRRPIDRTILQSVVRAIREACEIEIFYRSTSTLGARQYRIFPHALIHDGFRWSVRCYVRRGLDGHWGEMVLDRIEEVSGETWPADASLLDGDEEWRTIVEVELVPNPGLDAAGRSLIEEQYEMQNGRKIAAVRRCMLAYFLKRYQLEEPTTLKAPHQAPLDLRDRAIMMDLVPLGMRVPLEDSSAAAPRAMRRLQFLLPDYTEQEILERALADLLRSIVPED